MWRDRLERRALDSDDVWASGRRWPSNSPMLRHSELSDSSLDRLLSMTEFLGFLSSAPFLTSRSEVFQYEHRDRGYSED